MCWACVNVSFHAMALKASENKRIPEPEMKYWPEMLGAFGFPYVTPSEKRDGIKKDEKGNVEFFV